MAFKTKGVLRKKLIDYESAEIQIKMKKPGFDDAAKHLADKLKEIGVKFNKLLSKIPPEDKRPVSSFPEIYPAFEKLSQESNEIRLNFYNTWDVSPSHIKIVDDRIELNKDGETLAGTAVKINFREAHDIIGAGGLPEPPRDGARRRHRGAANPDRRRRPGVNSAPEAIQAALPGVAFDHPHALMS